MNLNDPRHPWTRLTAAARQGQDDRDASAPYGFSTRIAALAFAQEQRVFSLFERFAFRAVGLSCLLALGSVALNYATLTTPTTTTALADDVLAVDDAVTVVLDLGD